MSSNQQHDLDRLGLGLLGLAHLQNQQQQLDVQRQQLALQRTAAGLAPLPFGGDTARISKTLTRQCRVLARDVRQRLSAEKLQQQRSQLPSAWRPGDPDSPLWSTPEGPSLVDRWRSRAEPVQVSWAAPADWTAVTFTVARFGGRDETTWTVSLDAALAVTTLDQLTARAEEFRVAADTNDAPAVTPAAGDASEAAGAPRFCSQCGVATLPAANFCAACGHPLRPQ